MVRRAYCLIREQPVYRRDAFMAGLKAAGLAARIGRPAEIERGDVLVIWNRYGEMDALACRVEAAGGTVLVAENGYVGPGGASPHHAPERTIYALAAGGHNGSGWWPVGGPERWDALGIELKPWRVRAVAGGVEPAGGHVLVCPNRSFGRPDVMMPPGWSAHVCKQLTRRAHPWRERPHPGNAAPKVPLARDLARCRAMVIWSSSAGVHALIAGVPVVCLCPKWICKGAALDTLESIERWPSDAIRAEAWDGMRRIELQRLAWAQWHVDELATGEPFRRLLERDHVRAVA